MFSACSLFLLCLLAAILEEMRKKTAAGEARPFAAEGSIDGNFPGLFHPFALVSGSFVTFWLFAAALQTKRHGALFVPSFTFLAAILEEMRQENDSR